MSPILSLGCICQVASFTITLAPNSKVTFCNPNNMITFYNACKIKLYLCNYLKSLRVYTLPLQKIQMKKVLAIIFLIAVIYGIWWLFIKDKDKSTVNRMKEEPV